jgi:hypothetical protein
MQLIMFGNVVAFPLCAFAFAKCWMQTPSMLWPYIPGWTWKWSWTFAIITQIIMQGLVVDGGMETKKPKRKLLRAHSECALSPPLPRSLLPLSPTARALGGEVESRLRGQPTAGMRRSIDPLAELAEDVAREAGTPVEDDTPLMNAVGPRSSALFWCYTRPIHVL